VRGPTTITLRLRHTWRVLLKELSAFGLVGAINFTLDVAIFQLMYAVVGADALLSKVVSTSITTTTAYFMHRHWSFSHRARTGIRREYPIFILVNVLTLVLSLLMIGFVHYALDQSDALILQLTNITSIGIGTVIRFLAYKRWVFPLGAQSQSRSEADAAGGTQLSREPENQAGGEATASHHEQGLPTPSAVE